MSPRLEAELVRAHARGRWGELLARLAPDLAPALARPGKHGPCPVHGGVDGFRVFADVEQTGGGICNSCGARGDGFALLQWINRWGFPDALAAVAEGLGLGQGGGAPPPPAPPRPPPGHPGQDKAPRAFARRTLDNTRKRCQRGPDEGSL